MSGALAGIKVVEAASYVTAPFASQLLADMEAEVIKIEEPKRGDPFRGWGERNYAATFCSLNRNKQSITLDLSNDQATEIARKLASREMEEILVPLGMTTAKLLRSERRV